MRRAVRVFRDGMCELENLRIEIVDEMERNGFRRHRQHRAAKIVRPVMAENHVHDSPFQFAGKRFTRFRVQLANFLGHHFDADDEMANQLAFIGVLQAGLAGHLADFAKIVQEDAAEHEVGVQLRVNLADFLRNIHQCDDMFEQAAVIGMMGLHPGRCVAEARPSAQRRRESMPSVP